MARPKRVERSIQKTISFPEELVGRVDLLLFSEVEQKVPFGAWQAYLVRLIKQDLAQQKGSIQRG